MDSLSSQSSTTRGIPVHYRSPQMMMAMGNNPNISDEAKIKEVGIQFESIMVKEMLNQSLGPIFKNQMKNVPGGNIYQGMIIDNLADTIARSGQMGIAKVFERELLRLNHSKVGNSPKEDIEVKKMEKNPRPLYSSKHKPEFQAENQPKPASGPTEAVLATQVLPGSVQDQARKQRHLSSLGGR